MIHAYAEEYVNDAMKNLGEAFDYAVNECQIDIEQFMDMFIVSGFAEAFSRGVPKVVVGLSGTELVMEVLRKSGMAINYPEPQIEYGYSAEYWCGWILAYYQWYTGKSFKEIKEDLSMSEILKLYPTLHEASEEKFIDTVTAIINNQSKPTKLQLRRKQCGLSQRELAELSGVNLRTLQQYEMRAKDINKAAVTTLLALSKVLNCKVEELIEKI